MSHPVEKPTSSGSSGSSEIPVGVVAPTSMAEGMTAELLVPALVKPAAEILVDTAAQIIPPDQIKASGRKGGGGGGGHHK